MLEIERIYKEHSKTVYRYLISLTGNTDLAEELTQETFYQAIKSSEKFDGSCKVSTWLCAIAKNQLMAYKRKHLATAVLEDESISVNSAENFVLEESGRLEILKKLHLFNDEVREVMYLRLFGNLSFREIGDILLKSENWARVTYYRGKEKLRKEIEADGE